MPSALFLPGDVGPDGDVMSSPDVVPFSDSSGVTVSGRQQKRVRVRARARARARARVRVRVRGRVRVRVRARLSMLARLPLTVTPEP